ncbi:30S ribosomal protein S6 [Candidatus Parcubacteria bacterium]|nr:30S ribosomal protein S6 [Candidatus Parcubacteria bacterium]
MQKTDAGQVYSGAPLYEVSFLISPNLPEENVAAEVAAITGFVEKVGGEILFSEAPKMRPLAYSMIKSHVGKREKFDSAYFGSFIAGVEKEGAATLVKSIESLPAVVRALVVSVPKEALFYAEKRIAAKAERDAKHAAQKEEASAASAAELDKTIDQLVIE